MCLKMLIILFHVQLLLIAGIQGRASSFTFILGVYRSVFSFILAIDKAGNFCRSFSNICHFSVRLWHIFNIFGLFNFEIYDFRKNLTWWLKIKVIFGFIAEKCMQINHNFFKNKNITAILQYQNFAIFFYYFFEVYDLWRNLTWLLKMMNIFAFKN